MKEVMSSKGKLEDKVDYLEGILSAIQNEERLLRGDEVELKKQVSRLASQRLFKSFCWSGGTLVCGIAIHSAGSKGRHGCEESRRDCSAFVGSRRMPQLF